MVQNNLLAQASQKYIIGGPGIPVTNNLEATSKFETYASQLVGMLTIVAVLYFIIQIIFAGYAFISSQGDEKVMEATRKRLTEAVLGLFIVVIAIGLGSLIAMLLGIPNVLDINSWFSKMGL
jgi:hypothetical protein